MRYVLVLALGILTGLSFSRLPHYQPFRDQPGDPEDWTPKMIGAWTDEERAMLAGRYFNGGRETR